jgi:hypothetical protein
MSPEDLKNLAHDYEDLADTFVSWRAANPIVDPTLSEQFDDMVADLVAKANKLESLAVAAALANIETSGADLRSATQKARHALTVIKDFNAALAIGGAAVGVVASLVAPVVSAATVAGALSGLIQCVRKTTTATAGPDRPDKDT